MPTPQRFDSPGRHRSVEAFREHLRGLAPDADCVTEPAGSRGPLARPLEVGLLSIPNRFVAQPMEGWDGNADGSPSALTLRRWRRFGRSGAGLVWGGEAFAVTADGRANPNQLHLRDPRGSAADLVRLIDELRAGVAETGEDPGAVVVGLQLTHSGRWSRPDGPPAPRIAVRHPVLDRRVGVTDDAAVLTDAELEAIAARYIEAAGLARAAGFDFVDVKACHGYLLHELLGARGRPGCYGGSFENRTALFRRIVAGIRAACPDLAIGVRVSIVDVHPFVANADTRIGEPDGFTPDVAAVAGFGRDAADPLGFDFDEPLRFLGLCRDLGIRLVNLTVGSPYYCPHLQRPAAYPPSDGYLPPEDPLLSVVRHLRVARRCKAEFPDLTFVGTGYTYLQEYLPHVAEHEVGRGHVDLVGIGRMLLSYPELPRDVLADRGVDRKRICRTFSDCTTAPRHGLVSGCYPLDDFYKDRPEAAQVKEIKRAAGLR